MIWLIPFETLSVFCDVLLLFMIRITTVSIATITPAKVRLSTTASTVTALSVIVIIISHEHMYTHCIYTSVKTMLEDVGMIVPKITETRCTIQAKAGDDGMQP